MLRRSRLTRLQWLYPGLGMKRRVLAVCAGGALVGLSGWFALGILVSSGRRHDVGGTWITGHVGPASVSWPSAWSPASSC